MGAIISPTEIGVAGIFIILVLKEVGTLVSRVKNGKGNKDETKEYKILYPCKNDRRFQEHMEETRSAFETAKRCETSHVKLGEGITTLVMETTKQTGLLEQLVKNGKR